LANCFAAAILTSSAPLFDQVFKNPFKDVSEEMTKPKEEKALLAVLRCNRFLLRCLEADGGNYAKLEQGVQDG
jgi:hypothetical protein